MPAHDPGSATVPAPRRTFGMYRIALVCLGNIWRSRRAEGMLRGEPERAGLSGGVEVDRGGTGDWHLGEPMDPRARDELSRRGYHGAGHRARQFEPSWFKRYDLVLAMDASNLARLRRMAPDREAAERTVPFLSFDPARAASGDDLGGPAPYHGGPGGDALVL